MITKSHSLFNSRIPSLDGLRAISIIFVIVSHLLMSIKYELSFDLGNLGVRIFFVISGFLITGLLLKEIDKTGSIDLKKFYFRRTLRIFPPYYFYLCVMLLFSLMNWVEIPLSYFFSAFSYTSDYLKTGWFLGHTWSLSVEEKFYLIYPGIIYLLGRKKTIWLLVVIILANPIVRIIDFRFFNHPDAGWITYGFHSNADVLAIGCLLAFLYSYLHQNTIYLKILNSKILIFTIPIFIIAMKQMQHPVIRYGIAFTTLNVLIALYLDWSIINYKENFIGRVLNSSPMITLGIMSYSIYLWQQPFTLSYSNLWFTKFPFNIFGIIICSCFSYYIIEKFSLRWRHKLEKKYFSKENNFVCIEK